MRKFVMALAVAAAAPVAHANQPSHPYVTVAGGVTHLNIDCAGATSCDRNGSGGKVVLGYDFGNRFSLEGGYISFGKASGADAGIGATVKPSAWLAGGRLSMPMSPTWGVDLRLGAAKVKTRLDARVGAATGSASESKTKAYAGMGVTYIASSSVKLELAADATQAAFATEKGMVRLISVAASFAF